MDMNRKLLPLIVVTLMVLGSFGAVGFEVKINKNDTKLKEISFSNRDIKKLCGFEAPDNWWDEVEFSIIKTSSSLPSTFDWRDKGGVTPVKDQENCGSCWAFGTVAPLESAIKIKEGRTVDLSEQWLVSCNKDGWGCNGGWWAHDYHEWKKGKCGGYGAVLESEFPYKAEDKPCGGGYNHPYLVKNWAFIGSEHGTPLKSAIKQAIIDYGPVSAAVRATSDWEYYNGGVYSNNAEGRVNHAITLVGWDDAMGSNGVWILKNSWGTGWGDNGYMYIEYGCSSVGYSACYVDGYRGPPQENEEEVTFAIKEITNDPNVYGFDPIDPPGNKPEWYYRAGATISGQTEYQNNYNIDPDGWWIFKWLSYHTWKPKENHIFITDSPNIELTFKLMDDDIWPNPDDLADVSAEPGGGVDQDTSDHRPSIYHGNYNLVTDEISGDSISDPDSEGYRYTIGDGINNAKVWFKITDTYNGEPYKPELEVDPSKIDFGKKEGGTHSDTFTISNLAEYDKNEWQKLEWTATDNKDWISIDKTSGSLNGGTSEVITVTVNANDLSEGGHTGEVSISSNGGSKEVTIEINKEKVKSTEKIDRLTLFKNLSLLLRKVL